MPQFDIMTIGAQVFGLLVTLLVFYYYSITSTIPSYSEIKTFRSKKLIKKIIKNTIRYFTWKFFRNTLLFLLLLVLLNILIHIFGLNVDNIILFLGVMFRLFGHLIYSTKHLSYPYNYVSLSNLTNTRSSISVVVAKNFKTEATPGVSKNKNMHEIIVMFVIVILFMITLPASCAQCAPTDQQQEMVLNIPEVAAPAADELQGFVLGTPRVTVTPGVFYELRYGGLIEEATLDFASVSTMASSADIDPNIAVPTDDSITTGLGSDSSNISYRTPVDQIETGIDYHDVPAAPIPGSSFHYPDPLVGKLIVIPRTILES